MLIEKQNIINRKVIMVQREMSLRKVADAVGCSAACVMFAVNKAGQSRRMHERIAAVLNVTLAEFWPELYGPDKSAISHDDLKVNEINESVN